ncbi:pyridoxal phosphate-dependent decarboxylase family protein [Micromonospora sp. URMC 103]|uniref:pyridoxal phosphate-dependent decarboxylase family protein n=1 Tax=Micromonospora sp. URMC 103 TaxID=3423406 RepID=UPI003F1BD393
MTANPPARPDTALDPSPATVRDMGAAALEWVAAYQDAVRDLPIAPRATAAELRKQLAEPLPVEGRDFADLLEVFREVVAPGSRHSGHPRFFGYISAPGTAVASVADLLASALNANLPAWRSAPAPTELEHVVIDWIKEALGCDPGADGLLMSGGSMANFTALAAARHRHCGDAVAAQGAGAHPAPLRVYVSTKSHHSVHKAAALLGIGRANVREIAVDDRFRMDVDDLVRRIEEDLAAGAEPFCVVATAGTVVTGAVDPLREIAAVARRYGLWLHVDACYGGFARLAPSARPLFDGLSEADSISLDPHKWLYLPADCGCLIYRDPEAARAAFALDDADYVRITQTQPAEAFAFWDYGPDLSRRFRALKLWMLMAYAGTRALGEAIESNLDCARHLADLVAASDDFELLAPVELSIFCFRYLPPAARTAARTAADEEALDRLNERILTVLQQGGSSYLSNASVDGRFALRGCVVNYRTTRRDMEVLLDDVRRAAEQVSEAPA